MSKPRIIGGRRTAYPYECQHCTIKRITFDHARAKSRCCGRCEKTQPPEGQEDLFTSTMAKLDAAGKDKVPRRNFSGGGRPSSTRHVVL